MTKVGIVDWAIYLPKNIVTAKEIARETIVHGIDEKILIEKFGIIKKRISDSDEHVSDMCIKAAKSLLDKSGLDPLEIDLVVYNGSQFTDYYVWPCAPTVQDAIGADNAFCYDLHALCVGGPLALYQVKSMLLLDKEWENALIVSGTKESYLIDYKDRATSFMWDFADGASAVWIRKGHDRNIILSGSFTTDGYYNHVYNNSGSRGILAGVPPEEMRYLRVNSTYHRIMKEEGRKGYRNFRELSKANFVKVIKEAVRKSGYSLNDLKYVALLHLIPSFRREILREVGLTEENSASLDEVGHLQSSDWIVSIDLGLKSGMINEGDLVVAVGAGTGFTWGATAIRWG